MSEDAPQVSPQVWIEDADLLYRRLHHTQVYPNGEVKRLAFMFDGKPDGQASVYLKRS